MANIAVVLKEEISRLARKEIKAHTQKLHKAVAQFRKEIAALKRHSADLRSQITSTARQARAAGAAATVAPKTKGIRFTAKGVRSHRSLLGFSAANYGLLVGVTGHTIYKWEQGGARPRNAQLAALANIRGLRKKEALARLEILSNKPKTSRRKPR